MYAVGIDISKNKSTVAIIKDGEIFAKPFSINHTDDGINFLISKISNINPNDVKFVMEATGIYHFPLLFKLLDLKYFVSVENAFLLKKFFDVSLRKAKTYKLYAIKVPSY